MDQIIRCTTCMGQTTSMIGPCDHCGEADIAKFQRENWPIDEDQRKRIVDKLGVPLED